MDEEVDTFTKVVLVENLHYTASEDDIRRFFDNCGTITNIRIVLDKRNKPKGNAFVAFENHDMALEALSKDEKRFLDRYVFVELNKSSRIEEELTVKEEPPKFSPMLGKPFSENPLILKAYDLLKDKKKKEKKVEEPNKEIETKKEEVDKEKVKVKQKSKEDSNRHRHHHHHKKHERSSKDRHYHHYHKDKNCRHHRRSFDEIPREMKKYYSEIPEII